MHTNFYKEVRASKQPEMCKGSQTKTPRIGLTRDPHKFLGFLGIFRENFEFLWIFVVLT